MMGDAGPAILYRYFEKHNGIYNDDNGEFSELVKVANLNHFDDLLESQDYQEITDTLKRKGIKVIYYMGTHPGFTDLISHVAHHDIISYLPATGYGFNIDRPMKFQVTKKFKVPFKQIVIPGADVLELTNNTVSFDDVVRQVNQPNFTGTTPRILSVDYSLDYIPNRLPGPQIHEMVTRELHLHLL